jgi:hypothetical protein
LDPGEDIGGQRFPGLMELTGALYVEYLALLGPRISALQNRAVFELWGS